MDDLDAAVAEKDSALDCCDDFLMGIVPSFAAVGDIDLQQAEDGLSAGGFAAFRADLPRTSERKLAEGALNAGGVHGEEVMAAAWGV